MQCEIARGLMDESLQGRLPIEIEFRLMSHTATCDACRDDLERTRDTIGLVKGLEVAPRPPDLARKVALRIEDVTRSRSTSRSALLEPVSIGGTCTGCGQTPGNNPISCDFCLETCGRPGPVRPRILVIALVTIGLTLGLSLRGWGPDPGESDLRTAATPSLSSPGPEDSGPRASTQQPDETRGPRYLQGPAFEDPQLMIRVFRALDQDADGVITRNEWESDGRKAARFRRLDANGDRVLDITELPSGQFRNESGARFGILDRDRNGQLTLEDVGPLGAEDLQVFLRHLTAADLDRSGGVSASEYENHVVEVTIRHLQAHYAR